MSSTESTVHALLEQGKQEAEAARLAKLEKQKEKESRSMGDVHMRERVLNEYGFTELSSMDENGNVTYISEEQATGGSSRAIEGVAENSNRGRVRAAQAAERLQSKQEHEKKVAREKDLLMKDKARKEARKKKTVKREKQRGCG